MPSRTSCFKTLIKSDWRHYWPLCFFYTVLWIITQPIALWQQTNWKSDLPMIWRVGSLMANHVTTGWVCGLFAILTAMAVWSYLMRGSSVQFMHALPATRLTQFTAHFAAGFSMLTAGHIITFLAILGVMAARDAVVWSAALLWLLIAELTALFFFALAALSCVITGWLLAAPVLYGGINCVFIAAATLIQELMVQCDYWGYARGQFPRFVFWLTPLYQMATDYNADFQYLDVYDSGIYTLNPRALPTAAIYGAAGLVLAACAYLLYRKRPSETAGDAVSFRWLRPIVKWVISLCGGMVCGLFIVSLFLGETNVVLSTVFICIFGVICYIAVEMLLRKSFRVFRRTTFIGCAILCAVLVATSTVLDADVFGYQKYLPAAEDIKSVQIYGGINCVFFDDPQEIEKVLAIHRELIGENAEVYCDVPIDCTDTSYLDINYTLKNDRGLCRNYYFYVPRDEALHQMLNDFLNDPAVREQTIFPNYEPGQEENISGGIINLYDYTTVDEIAQEYGINRQFGMTETQAREIYRTLAQESHEKGQQDILAGDELQCEFNFEVLDNRGYFIYDTVHLDACPRTFQLLVDFGFIEPKG